MWLIIGLLSILFYAGADLLGKKCVNDGISLVPIELIVSSSVISVAVSIILYIFGVGESGMAPWEILYHNPLIIVNMLCFVLQWVFYLLSMRYINLSIAEAISGSTGVFYFVGMILVNIFLGKLSTVREMFHPLRLIPIILVLVFLFLYPNLGCIANKEDSSNYKKDKRKFRIGFFVLLLSLILDSLDSLLTTFIIDDNSVGMIDYMMTSYFATIFPIIVFSIIIYTKRKKWFIPLKDDSKFEIFYCVMALASSISYIAASYFDAVRTGIMFLVYPVVPIIGAKLILKEKHTWQQNLCIWVITFSAIAFCVSDYVI